MLCHGSPTKPQALPRRSYSALFGSLCLGTLLATIQGGCLLFCISNCKGGEGIMTAEECALREEDRHLKSVDCAVYLAICSVLKRLFSAPQATLQGAGLLFCSPKCEGEYIMAAGGSALRRKLRDLERGRCSICKLDCLQILKSLRCAHHFL